MIFLEPLHRMYLNIKGKNDYQLEGSAGTFT